MNKKIVRFLTTAPLEGVFYYKNSLVAVSDSQAKALIKNDTCASHKLLKEEERLVIIHQKPKGKKDGNTKNQD